MSVVFCVVKPLKNVVDTARDLGATKFVRYLKDSGIGDDLSKEGTYTLFAPLDSAFDVSIRLYSYSDICQF